MKKHEKYLKVLQLFTDYITVREWATKFIEIYPNEVNNTKSTTRDITKNISSIISSNKLSDVIIIDRNTKPMKIKYSPQQQNQQTHILKESEKFYNFQELMKILEMAPDDDDFPHRNDTRYCGEKKTKGIEQFEIYQFHSCVIFEMAIRNKHVIEIINKLDYIEKLQEQHPYLEFDQDILFKQTNNDLGNGLYITEESSDDSSTLPILTAKIEEQLIKVATLPLQEFMNELEFLVDEKYSNNFNQNWFSDMEKNGYTDPFSITDELMLKYKFKDSTGKVHPNKDLLTGGKIHIIFKYLQDELKYKYFIFPNGYFKGIEEECHEQVVDKNIILQRISNFNELTDDINDAIIEFKTLKPTDMRKIADMFFMYDYATKRQEKSTSRLYLEDIKAELTKYHGIKITREKKLLSYDYCLKNYDRLKDSTAEFYTVEKTIYNKVQLMKRFIETEDELYKYLLFY